MTFIRARRSTSSGTFVSLRGMKAIALVLLFAFPTLLLLIAIPAFVAYYIFRNMSQASIVHADDIVNTLITDVPYDELAGMQVGENFAAAGVPQMARPIGVTTAAAAAASCPVCAGNVTVGQSPCPHCGSVLSW